MEIKAWAIVTLLTILHKIHYKRDHLSEALHCIYPRKSEAVHQSATG